MVRSTFSPARAWRPAVGARLARTLDVMKATFVLAAVIPLVLAAPILSVAHSAGTVEPTASASEVYTRAIIQSISTDEGKHLYIRLKLMPLSKIPFSTVTYRVLDARLVAGLRKGDSVAFKAERLDGGNVLTALHTATPCERFKECK